MRPPAIVLLGRKGAGKSTQAPLLAAALANARVYSSSSAFRAAAELGAEAPYDLGARIASALDAVTQRGAYFDDRIARDLLRSFIDTHHDGPVIVEGMPRTLGQIGYVHQLLDVRVAAEIRIDDETVLESRIRSRGRGDDGSPRALLEDDNERAGPVRARYRSGLLGPYVSVEGVIDGAPASVEDVHARLLDAVRPYLDGVEHDN